MNRTSIGYVDYSWNPITGCLHGCPYCYARRIAERFRDTDFDQYRNHYPEEYVFSVLKPMTRFKKGSFDITGAPFPYGFQPTFHQYRLDEPKRKKLTKADVKARITKGWLPQNQEDPLRIFVCDMGDIMGAWVPTEWINAVLQVVRDCPQHIFLFLTKNPKRYPEFEWPANAHLGTTVESQDKDWRIVELLKAKASVYWLSVEPMLGPLDVKQYFPQASRAYAILSRYYGPNGFDPTGSQPEQSRIPGLDLIVGGGQSGPGARPVHPDWIRSLRDQCQAAGTAFYLKQLGEWVQVGECMNGQDDSKYYLSPKARIVNHEGGQGFHGAGAIYMQRVGKKAAGRLLDGRTWDEFPVMPGA